MKQFNQYIKCIKRSNSSNSSSNNISNSKFMSNSHSGRGHNSSNSNSIYSTGEIAVGAEDDEFCCILFGYMTRCATCQMPPHITPEFVRRHYRYVNRNRFARFQSDGDNENHNNKWRRNRATYFNKHEEMDSWERSLKILGIDINSKVSATNSSEYSDDPLQMYYKSISIRDIKRAYLKKVKSTHPDVHTKDHMQESKDESPKDSNKEENENKSEKEKEINMKFIEIQEAYEYLISRVSQR